MSVVEIMSALSSIVSNAGRRGVSAPCLDRTGSVPDNPLGVREAEELVGL